MLRRIGGGSYGEVWLARSVTGALRAVKIVRREDFDLERTFEREFSGIQRYEKVSQDHSGLVDVLHVGRNDDEGYYYYVMELADDADDPDWEHDIDVDSYQPRTLMSDLRKVGSQSLGNCIATGRSLAGALGHLHRNGLTHRDVKPSNIIFIRGVAKMADIGLVAHSGQRSYVGTEGYVPPEGPGTAVADLYSLAMVLYEMHTGKDRLDFPELPTNLELPRTVNRDEWRALNNVICHAGSPDPKKRFSSADDFVAALNGVSKDSAMTAQSKSGGRYALVAVLLTLAVVAGAWGVKHAFAPVGPTGGNGGKGKELAGESGEGADGGRGNGAESGETDTSGGADTTSIVAVGEGEQGGTSDSGPASLLASNGGASGTSEEAPVFRDAESTVGSAMAGRDSDGSTDGTIGGAASAESAGGDDPVTPKMALFKVSSYPSGASVWFGEELQGHTPTRFLKFTPGATELVVRLDGYHDEVIERDLQAGDNPLVYVSMRQDRRPIGGQPWTNAGGMRFRYEGSADDSGFHISEGEIGSEPVARFLEAVGRGDDPLVEIGGAALLDEADQWAFCDWTTRLDRRGGYLSEDEYHRPQGALPKGPESGFYSVVDKRFGEVELVSEPSGAVVVRDGKRLGETPLTLLHERAGPFLVSLDLPGYRSTAVEGRVVAGRRAHLSAPLERDDSLVFGEPWTNSLGMTFAPVGDLMAAVHETRVRDYQGFTNTEAGAEHAPLAPQSKQEEEFPIVGVGLEDARAFCRWLTETERGLGRIENYHEYRLPTDLEWSLLAGLEGEGQATPQARDSRVPDMYPWGTEWPPPAGSGNFRDESVKRQSRRPILKDYNDGFEKVAPVGNFRPNRYGLHDLAGNVWEWVDDLYGGEGSPLATVRGGGFNVSAPDLLLTSYRNAIPATLRDDLYGFRCVLVEDRGLAETAWSDLQPVR